jgi:hypothetical protein
MAIILNLMERKQQEEGENCTMTNFILVSLLQVSLGCSNQGRIYSTYGGDEYNILVGQTEGKRPLGRCSIFFSLWLYSP